MMPSPELKAFTAFLNAFKAQLPDDAQPDKVGPTWSVKHTGPNRAARRKTQKAHGFKPKATNQSVRKATNSE